MQTDRQQRIAVDRRLSNNHGFDAKIGNARHNRKKKV